MKKTVKITLITLLVLMLYPINTISAKGSVSGPKTTLTVGESTTITITESDIWGMIQVNVSASGSVKVNTNLIFEDTSGKGTPKGTITVTAVSPGTGTVSLRGKTESSDSSNAVTSINSDFTFTVKEKVVEKPAPEPEKPITPGKPTTPQKPTEPTGPTAEEIAQAEKEAKQRIPLISKIDIVSNSTSHTGSILNTIEPSENTWEYEYTLPKRIDKFLLDVVGTSDSVVLTYDKEYEFAEGETEPKEITIRAVSDDITQEYTLKVSPDTTAPLEVTVGESKQQVFEDKIIDEFMTARGFTVESYENDSEIAVPYYAIDDIKLQLLVDTDSNAKWYRMDESNNPTEKVALVFDADDKPLIVVEAPEEEQKQTVREVSYKEKEFEVPTELKNVDSSLKWDNKYSAWSTDEGDIVQALRTNTESDKFRISPEKDVVAAVVSFDQINTSMYQWWAYISTGLLVVVSAAFILYINKNNKLKKSAL